MTELERLEQKLRSLTTKRNVACTQARQNIARANAQFDAAAVPLRRQIEKIRATEEKAKPRPKTKRKHTGPSETSVIEMMAYLDSRRKK